MRSDLVVRLAVPSDASSLAALFDRSSCTCFCRYHDFNGDHREWQARMAQEPERSRIELDAALGQETTGLVAFRGTDLVGWLRFGPRAGSQLYRLRAFKGLACLDGPGHGIASLYCLLVAPSDRRSGVARSLVSAWIGWAREQGSELEVLARGEGGHMDEEFFSGPARLLDELGFTRVHDFAAYPVFRWRSG